MAKTDEDIYVMWLHDGKDVGRPDVEYRNGYRTCEKEKDAEIERLKAEVKRLEQSGITTLNDYREETRMRLDAESELTRLHGIIERANDDGAMAVRIAESITPKLEARETAFVVAGFQICAKHLLSEAKGDK